MKHIDKYFLILFLTACGQKKFVTKNVSALSGSKDSAFDEPRAVAALVQIGANVPGSTLRCAVCHEVNQKSTYLRWIESTRKAKVDCFENQALPTDRERLNCLRIVPQDETSNFSGAKIGIFRAGAHLDRFKSIFTSAYGRFVGPIYYNDFRDLRMPRNASPQFLMTQEQFDMVLSWILDGAPGLDEVLGSN